MQQRKTAWIKVPENLTLDAYRELPEVQQAAELLRNGELVAFPTETVYGIGADGTSAEAVEKIFLAKGRPADNPLIIHLGEKSQIEQWVKSVSPLAEKLIHSFWPGPLTLVVEHHGKFAPQVTAGLSTVAIRVPAHPVAQALIQLAGLPIAAPSANRSGRLSPTKAEHVFNDLKGNIACLIDGGTANVGVESTVVDVTGEQPILLRPGGISIEEIEEKVGRIKIDPAILSSSSKPRSPGMKYRHYAPDGELWLFEGDPLSMVQTIQQEADRLQKEGKRVGILTTEEQKGCYHADVVIACGTRERPETVAKALFHTLHQLNEAKVDFILAETFPEQGIYLSVMNRLKKAANGRIVKPFKENNQT